MKRTLSALLAISLLASGGVMAATEAADEATSEKKSPLAAALGYSLTTLSAPTTTQQRQVEIASDQFGPWLENLRELVADLEALEGEMAVAGAPWTPGRIPVWEPE